MENWGTTVVVLAAVLVGVAIPLLVQLRATARAAEQALRRSGAGLDEALGAVTAAAHRLDALVARLDEGGRLEKLLDGLVTATRTLDHLKDGLRVASAVGAAVGPALAAAVHALREGPPGPSATPPPASPSGASGAPTHPNGKQATT